MNSTAPIDDLDFDLPELDDDDDPFPQDTFDRRNKRIHAWLRAQCCLVLPSQHKSLDNSDASRTLKHRHSSTAGSSAQTTTDDGSELEDARADSPLLGFTAPSHSRSASAQRLAEFTSSPLPPCSPPTRRQSRLHANSISLSSGSPHALSHTSSTLSLAGMHGMRNAVYIDSDEIHKRLDDLMQTQAEADPIDEAQDLDYFNVKHRPQKSSSSISVFVPPSTSLQSFSAVGPSWLTAPPPNTPSHQTAFASSSQVYLGPAPPASRARSQSQSQSQVNLPHLSKDVKPPARPPPAPPLVIEPALTDIRDASITVPVNSHPYGTGNEDSENLSPPPGTVSKWSLASSTIDDGDKKEKKKRKSFIAGVIGPPAEKDKKRGRLVSFISRLSEVGLPSSGPTTPAFAIPDEYIPPVPTLLPSAIITAERKESSGQPPSSDAVPAPGTLKILTNFSSLQPHPSANSKPTGRVSGTWEPLSVSTSSQPVPSSPSGLLPQDPFAPPQPPSHPQTQTLTGLGRASSEGVIGSTLPTRSRANSSAAEQWLSKESKPLPQPPTPSGLGFGHIVRPRPTLTKSFSSSVLNGRYVYPQQHHNSSSIGRLRDQDEEEEEEDYGAEVERQQTIFVTRRRGLSSPMVMRGTPTTPVSATSTTFSHDTTGTMTPPTTITDVDTKGAALLHQMEAHRQRLRSMSSAGNISSKPLPTEPQGEARERKRGLRSLVHWMGLTSPSSTSPTETSVSRISESTVVPSTPSTLDFPFPPPTPMGSQFQGSSGASTPQKTPSLGHSPTASLSGIKDGLGGGILQSIIIKPKHKRRLVIAGVESGDADAVDAVRAWCENFGEIKDFTLAGDGTINVDFKKASVADTVCRLQAGVHIKGAGSVSVSWSTKRRM